MRRPVMLLLAALLCLTLLPVSSTAQAEPEVTHKAAQASGPINIEGLFEPGPVQQTIFGPDDRYRLSPPDLRTVLLVNFIDPNSPVGACTGTLIGPRTVLTAAHCLYNRELHGFAYGVAVFVGMDGNNGYQRHTIATDMIVPTGWSHSGNDYHLDYGLIRLAEPLGNQFGWRALAVASDATLRSSALGAYTIGYPGDKPQDTQWMAPAQALHDVDQRFLYIRHDVYQGQSGSGVMRAADDRLIGVVFGGADLYNAAVRVTARLVDQLRSWCVEYGCELSSRVDPDVIGRDAHNSQAFTSTWERTDRPVLEQAVSRTWMWGPQASTGFLSEDYAEGPGGRRTVIYYEKSRMELTVDSSINPHSEWYITNGLLSLELITGRMQAGNNAFEQRTPAQVNVAGDANDPLGPTYATFAGLLNAAAGSNGAAIIQRIDRNGNVTSDATLTRYGVYAANRVTVPGIDHQVASPFWAFMNGRGLVFDQFPFTDALFPNPFYATGYPITEPYWASVKVADVYRDVLVQCLERRCLTYTPGNPAGWEVEAGNVGAHYYMWRYGRMP